jgi:hypothetical protein
VTGNWGCDLCGKRWSGLAIAHCSGCCWTFNNSTALDAHQPRGRCVDPRTAPQPAKTNRGAVKPLFLINDGVASLFAEAPPRVRQDALVKAAKTWEQLECIEWFEEAS